MQSSPDHLLEEAWAEGLRLGVSCTKIITPSRPLPYVGEILAIVGCVPFRGATHGSGLLAAGRGDVLVLELADNVPIVFSSHATEKFKRHHKEDDSNARPGEHAFRGDMP